MSNNPVEAFLQQRIGLDSATIGVEVLQQMLRDGLRRTGLQLEEYAEFLSHSKAEQVALIEAVVVLETWFFRNSASFDFLITQLQTAKKRPLRVLSLPCATGEEAYSLAITLLKNGFQADLLRIDAVDVSSQALQAAQRACYRDNAFRDEHGEPIKQHFFQRIQPKNALHNETIYQVKAEVQKLVHWQQGNLLNAHLFNDSAVFDVIFCRNLLIYLTAEARATAMRHLRRWLKPSGLLFTGHAERNLACQAGFVQVPQAGVFACWHPQAPPAAKKPAAPPNTRFSPLRKPALPTDPAAQAACLSRPLVEAVEAEAPTYQALENAQQCADQGKLEQALQHCLRFLQAQPDAPQGHFLCALIHQARYDDRQAERYFRQALYLQPDHKQALHHLHMLLQRQGRVTQAKSLQQRLQRLRGHAS